MNVLLIYFNLDKLIRAAARRGVEVGCCGTCLDARGLTDEMLVADAQRRSMEDLGDWILSADQVVTF